MNFALVFIVLGTLFASTVASAGPLVNLSYAQYEGVYSSATGINTWFGIKFAQAPTGQLRWRAPQDIELNNNYSTLGAINATVPPPTCVQTYPSWETAPNITGVEDCLYLNVLVPASPVSSKLAVLIQIHGGAYVQGSAEETPGDLVVQQSNGSMIYVAIQYRLGPFGFLSSSEIKENGVANAGKWKGLSLLDMQSALMWVQRNIEAFGGDPSKVTIAGGSAGGGAVMNMMILYGGLANPPFRAVISEYPWWQPYHNDTILEAQYGALLNAAGCGDLQCLRGLSQEALIAASQQSYSPGYANVGARYYGYGDAYYGPSVDGEIIRDLPSNEFKKGHFTKVPLWVDRDGYEGVLFTNSSETTIAEETQDLRDLFGYAKSSFFTRLYQLYPSSAFNSTFFQRSAWFGDLIIDCPTYYMASSLVDFGMPVYKLIFDAGTETHSASGYFLFTTYGNNDTLAGIMRDWYVSFATELDPNAKSWSGILKPYWPTYNSVPGSFSVMDVNYTMIGVIEDPDASAQCDFWHGQSYVVRN